MYDDVSWETEGERVELIQEKLHLRSRRAQTDKDQSEWSTIGSWIVVHAPDDADGLILTLVTTHSAAPESPL